MGIVFASLVNFNELYDESYMGGKEFLRQANLKYVMDEPFQSFSRVLNELISDFDELLDQVSSSLTFIFQFACFALFIRLAFRFLKKFLIAMLRQAEFRNVEKIKTIGATFMAASGLNPFIRYSFIIVMIIIIMTIMIIIREENSHKYQHLMELMEFAFALQV